MSCPREYNDDNATSVPFMYPCNTANRILGITLPEDAPEGGCARLFEAASSLARGELDTETFFPLATNGTPAEADRHWLRRMMDAGAFMNGMIFGPEGLDLPGADAPSCLAFSGVVTAGRLESYHKSSTLILIDVRVETPGSRIRFDGQASVNGSATYAGGINSTSEVVVMDSAQPVFIRNLTQLHAAGGGGVLSVLRSPAVYARDVSTTGVFSGQSSLLSVTNLHCKGEVKAYDGGTTWLKHARLEGNGARICLVGGSNMNLTDITFTGVSDPQ